MKTINTANKVGLPVFIARTVAFLFLLLVSIGVTAYSQCRVSSLIITTGEYNYTSLAVGASDPLWIISNKTAPFTGGGAPAIGSTALVVNPDPGWGTPSWVGSAWICDYQPHANPGISTTTGSEITFKRTFVTCELADISFDMDILNDNRVRDILVDGASTGFNQAPMPPFVNNYGTGNDWFVSFTLPLAAGTHTLEIIVDDEYPIGGNDNPIGLRLVGNISTTSNVIINNFDDRCKDATCCDADNGGGHGDRIMELNKEIRDLRTQVEQLQTALGVANNDKAYASNELDQNTPNPVTKDAVIEYNIVILQKEAFITVTDLTGKQMMKIPVESRGRGKVTVDGSRLQPGIYLYSLTVDGRVADTKKMVISK